MEQVYEAMAEGIEAVGEDQAAVYLAKLALALAERLNDPQAAVSLARQCQRGLGRGAGA